MNEEKSVSVKVKIPFYGGSIHKVICTPDFEFTGKLLYQHTTKKSEPTIFAEIKYKENVKTKIENERKPQNVFERFLAVFFNKTFKDVEWKTKEKDIFCWVDEKDIEIIINVKYGCDNVPKLGDDFIIN